MKKEYQRYFIATLLLVVVFFLLLFLNIGIGSVTISAKQIIRILMGNAADETAFNIIWKIRLPRVIASIVLGGSLALSGFLLQTFFHNPIAGPFILGISSGAKMVVALLMVFVLNESFVLNSGMLVIAALAGSLISMEFVLIMAGKVEKISMLIVSGIMIGYICSAITDFVVTFADDSNIVNLHNWSRGTFSGVSWNNVRVMTIIILITTIIIFLLAKPIGAYQMGETYAQNMGVNIKQFRLLIILCSSILSACVTAFAGPISFVGIAVPHLIKRFLNTSKPIIMIPITFLGGAIFCMGCDLIARTAFSPTELSISSVTAIFGAPVVIWMMIRKVGDSTYEK
ncbi:MAG: FecCD family ABC transporter permease [Velocimicrobium sp.]